MITMVSLQYLNLCIIVIFINLINDIKLFFTIILYMCTHFGMVLCETVMRENSSMGI